MSLPRHLFTPAFRHQHLGRSLAAIVGIMVFIASFAMAAEAVLLTASYLWGRTMEDRLTVEIPVIEDKQDISHQTRVDQALAVLRAMPEVDLALALSENEVERLLKPWFENTELLKALPLPTLIDVERKPTTELTPEKVRTALQDVVADARVNDHGSWTKDIWKLVHGLTLLGGLTIALTAIALIIAVNLICRTVIATERETISLLHLMGAENADIARHFQSQTAGIAGRASAVGFLSAVGIILVLYYLTRDLADLSSLDLSHWAGVAAFSLAIPFSATAIATVAARFSVMRLIKTFP